MLLFLALIIVILWATGHLIFSGALINMLLVVALALVIYHFWPRRRL